MKNILKSNKVYIFYDSMCMMCSSTVRFLCALDTFDTFRFCPLNSKIQSKFVGIDSLIVITKKQELKHQGSALRYITIQAPLLWPLVPVLYFIPLFVLDRLYDYIAKARKRWFSKQEFCFVLHSKALAHKVVEYQSFDSFFKEQHLK